MSISIEAVVENGQVRLPEGTKLPERAKVMVIVPDGFDGKLTKAFHIPGVQLADTSRLSDFRIEMVEEPNP